jgi:hypothetical protein
MMFSTIFAERILRSNFTARRLLGSWRSPFLLLLILGLSLGKFVDVYVKFEELLSDKIFDKSIIINQFLIVDLCSALELDVLLFLRG